MAAERFDPEVVLHRGEQGALAQLVATEGYKILHRLLRGEVDKYFGALLNTDSVEPQDVLERHRLCKVAAQVFTGFTNRINSEVMTYHALPRLAEEPVDPTDGMLDLGPRASRDITEIQLSEEGVF